MPGAPPRLLNVDPTVFLAFVEGVLRESEENNESLNSLYESSVPRRPQTRDERRSAIARFARLTGGAA